MKPELTHLILSPSSQSMISHRATPSPRSNDTGATCEQDSMPDDLVPSLLLDWEPPSYCKLMLSPQSASSVGEVIHI